MRIPSNALSTFGRRFHKLTQLLENPQIWPVYRYGVEPEQYAKFRQPWFSEAGIRTVLDIGANTGQFAQLVHAVLPQARIYSFEPLPDCYAALAARTSGWPNAHSRNVALGRADGTITLLRNPYPDSSSIRQMNDHHRLQFPFTAGPQVPVEVTVRALDSLAGELDLTPRVFVKMDVQGYEDEVILGGREVLSRVWAVMLEVSFVPLYEGAPPFHRIYELLQELGFEFRGCVAQLVGPIDGEILQGDGLFVRTDRP